MIVKDLGDRTLIPLFIKRDGQVEKAKNAEEKRELEKVIPWMHDTMAEEPDDGSSAQP